MGILDTLAKTVGTVAEAVSGAVESVVGSSDDSASDNRQTATTSNATLKIQYYKSVIGFPKTQKTMVRSLGFTKLNQTLERPDNPATRGVVNKVPHLLRIVE